MANSDSEYRYAVVFDHEGGPFDDWDNAVTLEELIKTYATNPWVYLDQNSFYVLTDNGYEALMTKEVAPLWDKAIEEYDKEHEEYKKQWAQHEAESYKLYVIGPGKQDQYVDALSSKEDLQPLIDSLPQGLEYKIIGPAKIKEANNE